MYASPSARDRLTAFAALEITAGRRRRVAGPLQSRPKHSSLRGTPGAAPPCIDLELWRTDHADHQFRRQPEKPFGPPIRRRVPSRSAHPCRRGARALPTMWSSGGAASATANARAAAKADAAAASKCRSGRPSSAGAEPRRRDGRAVLVPWWQRNLENVTLAPCVL